MAKSETYDKAVARVNGKDQEVVVAPPAGTEMMVSNFDPQAFAKQIVEQDLECAPQLFSLQEGMQITGVLEGNGPIAEFADRDTGVVKEVQTWIIATADGRARVSILSSAQLDRKLAGFVGDLVTIARGKDVNIGGGHRMTEYLVAGKRRADGKRREWASAPKQLVAGDPVA